MDFIMAFITIPEIVHCIDIGLYRDNKDTIAIIEHQEKEPEYQL